MAILRACIAQVVMSLTYHAYTIETEQIMNFNFLLLAKVQNFYLEAYMGMVLMKLKVHLNVASQIILYVYICQLASLNSSIAFRVCSLPHSENSAVCSTTQVHPYIFNAK